MSNSNFNVNIVNAQMDFDGYLVGSVRVDGVGPFNFTYNVGDQELCSEVWYALEDAGFDHEECSAIQRICYELTTDLWLEIEPAYKNTLAVFNSTYLNDIVHKEKGYITEMGNVAKSVLETGMNAHVAHKNTVEHQM